MFTQRSANAYSTSNRVVFSGKVGAQRRERPFSTVSTPCATFQCSASRLGDNASIIRQSAIIPLP